MFKKNAWADICTINGQTVQEDDIKAQSKKILKEMPISNKAAHKFPILNSNEGTGQPRSNHWKERIENNWADLIEGAHLEPLKTHQKSFSSLVTELHSSSLNLTL